jgi:hypothetical protein
MYCSTCGANVAGKVWCSACGTRVADAGEPGRAPAPRYGSEDRRWMMERNTGMCPRCSYQGEGISYFSRGMNAAGLVGVTVLTAGAMGAGGIIYYLIRREHRVCPRCGKGWGRYGEESLAPIRRGAVAQRATAQVPSKGRESVRRIWSVLLAVFAVILMVGAIAGAELAPALFGIASGAGAFLLHRSANQEREARRAALLGEMQLAVLRLADERGGRLTVTQVAADMGWPMRRAERVLNSLDDGLRVNSEVTDQGVIVYEFREVMHSPRRLAEGEESGAREPRGDGPRDDRLPGAES